MNTPERKKLITNNSAIKKAKISKMKTKLRPRKIQCLYEYVKNSSSLSSQDVRHLGNSMESIIKHYILNNTNEFKFEKRNVAGYQVDHLFVSKKVAIFAEIKSSDKPSSYMKRDLVVREKNIRAALVAEYPGREIKYALVSLGSYNQKVARGYVNTMEYLRMFKQHGWFSYEDYKKIINECADNIRAI